MAKNKFVLFISVCSFLFLSGSSAYETLLAENQNNIQKISPGLTRSEVVEIMGTKEAMVKKTHVSNPYKSDFFTQDKDEYEILYYLTRKPAYTAIRESQATPIVIKNGKVIGLGSEAVKRAKRGK